jgi:hypothetical protein
VVTGANDAPSAKQQIMRPFPSAIRSRNARRRAAGRNARRAPLGSNESGTRSEVCYEAHGARREAPKTLCAEPSRGCVEHFRPHWQYRVCRQIVVQQHRVCRKHRIQPKSRCQDQRAAAHPTGQNYKPQNAMPRSQNRMCFIPGTCSDILGDNPVLVPVIFFFTDT